MGPWFARVAVAQQGVELREGETVVAPCLQVPECAEYWGPQLSETMIEAGYALLHDPVVTSALGGKGMGVVAEVGLESVPLGARNDLQALYPLLPAVPVLALGYQVGSYTYDAPYPQYAVGVHAVPPLRIGGGTTWSVGGTASFAIPLGSALWLGAEGAYSHASVAVQLFPDTDVLGDVEALDAYFGRNGPECEEPCVDRMRQHAGSVRAGVSFEPLPALFLYGRAGVAVMAQRLAIALDGSVWGWTPALPELSAGIGTRAGDRWQASIGSATAFRGAGATTSGRGMTKIVVATAFRFGDARYWERREPLPEE